MTTDFHDRYGPWALVGGASEGLGAAFAEEAARRGLHLVLVARRPEPLAETADRLRHEYRVDVRTVPADLGAPSTLDDLLSTATDGLEIGLVVANAAYAPLAPFLDLNFATLSQILSLNVYAPAALAQRYLPAMVARRRGGLVVVSSAAGLQGSPGLVAYAATKAFGRILAEGLWAELRPLGVDVVACVAGAVETPGLARTAMRRAPGTISARRVATEVYDSLSCGPDVVPGRFMRTATAVLRLLPRRTAIAMMGRAGNSLAG